MQQSIPNTTCFIYTYPAACRCTHALQARITSLRAQSHALLAHACLFPLHLSDAYKSHCCLLQVEAWPISMQSWLTCPKFTMRQPKGFITTQRLKQFTLQDWAPTYSPVHHPNPSPHKCSLKVPHKFDPILAHATFYAALLRYHKYGR